MKKGFTLIEIIIYIALFTILMVGVFVTSYQLLQGSDTLSTKTVTQEEINFVVRKINWALTGTSSMAILTAPSVNTQYASALSLKRADGLQIDFRYNEASSSIELREGGSPNLYLPLTTQNVRVTSFGFRFIPSLGGNAPTGIEATTTISGIVATTTKYIRK